MDPLCAGAARAAAARVASARVRGAQLASRRQFRREDVLEARAALDRATERAAIATLRLEHARCRRLDRAFAPTIPGAESVVCIEPSTLRADACRLPMPQLFAVYLAIGGRCSQFELDAFLHSVIELPTEERTILAQAIWEATEFQS